MKVGGFSGASCADSYVCSQLLSQLRSGWSVMDLAGMTLLWSKWSLNLQQVSTNLFTLRLHGIMGKHVGEQGLVSSLVRTSKTSVLSCVIGQRKYKANLHLSDEKASISWWEKLKITLQKKSGHISVIVSFLHTIYQKDFVFVHCRILST